MGQRSPLQFFRFDVSQVMNVADLVHSGIVSLYDISQALGMGQRKVRSLREWGCMANILENSHSTTELYQYIRWLREGGKYLEALQLVYYWICRNNPIVNYIVHDCGAPKRFTIEELNKCLLENNILSGITETNIRKGVSITLSSLIHAQGLGALKVVQRSPQVARCYVVHAQYPSLLVAAYIIYTNWPPNTAKVSIKEIVLGRNSLGRIFFLDEMQVMTILRKLEERGFVKVETVAGLNQIGINPKFTANDFLDMLISEEEQ